MEIFSEVSFDTILAILSFAVAIGGFYPVFRLQDNRKKIIISMILAVLVVTSVLAFVRINQHKRNVEFVSGVIIEKIGTSSVTIDQLSEGLFNIEYAIMNEALDDLIKKRIVGYKTFEVHDDNGKSFHVKGFYLKTE